MADGRDVNPGSSIGVKSLTQPDGGEGFSGMATGSPATVPGKISKPSIFTCLPN